MSLEAVQRVTESEQLAQQQKAEAAEQGKRLVSDAQRAGQARLEEAHIGAEAKSKDLLGQAEQRAARHTDTVMEETRRTCDGLRQAAEDRLEDAAALIIGKVVGV